MSVFLNGSCSCSQEKTTYRLHHVVNAKDSVVQILQSLSARVTWITWRISMILWILNYFYHNFKEIYNTSAVWKFMVCFTIMSMG